MTFGLDVHYPAGSIQQSDVRATFRAVVGSRIRRRMDAIAADMAAQTQYQRLKDKYRVVQTSVGAVLSVEVLNDDELWAILDKGTRPHDILIPAHWVAISSIEGWALAHGINPYALQYSLAHKDILIKHPGTKGEGVSQRVWDASANTIVAAIDEGTGAWLKSWGTLVE